MKAVWRKRASQVADAWREFARLLGELVRPLLVVGWCQASRSHFIEPWVQDGIQGDHQGCSICTWCQDCGRLLGRDSEEVEVP